MQLGINGSKMQELEECNTTLISSCRLLYTLAKNEENDEMFLAEKVDANPFSLFFSVLYPRVMCAGARVSASAVGECKEAGGRHDIMGP